MFFRVPVEKLLGNFWVLPTPSLFKFYEDSKMAGGWLGLLERIHGPLPLSEDLIVPDPTWEPLMIKAKRSNLSTMRPDEPRKEGQLALLKPP
jgi:hypothetical protein